MKVPEGWEYLRVEEFGYVHAGRQRSPHFKEGKLRPYLRVANIFDGFIDTSNVLKMYFTDSEFERYQLKAGDILLNEGQSLELVGRPAIFNNEVEDCCFQNTLVRFRSNEKSISTFSFQLFRNYFYSGKFASIASRTTSIAHLGVSRFARLRALLPPLPEQKRIARILSTWDRAIEATEKLIENSKQQKKTLMQQLLTGKKRLPGFEGEWRKVKLISITNVTMGSSPKSSAYNEDENGLPLLQGNADIKDRKSAPRFFTSQITKTCYPGDILISVRAPVGEVARSKHKACIGRGIAAICANHIADQEYIYQLLWDYEPKWVRFSQGSTFEAVNSNDLKDLTLFVPGIEEQRAIARILSVCDDSISGYENELRILKQQKKSLMQQLLTGKRRVKVEE